MKTKILIDLLFKHRILLHYNSIKISENLPYYFSYTAKNPSAPIPDGSAWNWNSTALSTSKEAALHKAIIRSTELYSLFSFNKFQSIKFCREKNVKHTFNVSSFLHFSKSEFNYSTDKKYGWIKVKNIKDFKVEYIPAQFIATAYYSNSCYYTNNNEDQLMNQYNTIYGIGSGKSVKEAIANAFLDSYQSGTFYWHIKNKIIPNKIELSKKYLDNKTHRIIYNLNKNGYEISCFNLSLNQKIPVILTIVRGIYKTNKYQFGYSFNTGSTYGRALANSLLASFTDLYRLFLIYKNFKNSNQFILHPFFIERSRFNFISSFINRKKYTFAKVDWDKICNAETVNQEINISKGWYLDISPSFLKLKKLKIVKVFIPSHLPPYAG